MCHHSSRCRGANSTSEAESELGVEFENQFLFPGWLIEVGCEMDQFYGENGTKDMMMAMNRYERNASLEIMR